MNDFKLLANNIRSHLVLLYHSRTGETGSGVLIKLLDRLFVISAAHVIESSNIINIGLDFQQTPFTELDKYIDDKLDIGYIEIKPFEYEILKVDQSRPFNISKIIRTYTNYQGKSFLLCGYPSELKKKKGNAFSITPLFLNCIALNPHNWSEFLKEIGKSPENNIVIAYGRKHGDQFYDMDGKPLPFYDTKGMSGCGIWIYDSEDGKIETDHYALVGIQHSYINSDQVLVCTFADKIIDVMCNRLNIQINENSSGT